MGPIIVGGFIMLLLVCGVYFEEKSKIDVTYIECDSSDYGKYTEEETIHVLKTDFVSSKNERLNPDDYFVAKVHNRGLVNYAIADGDLFFAKKYSFPIKKDLEDMPKYSKLIIKDKGCYLVRVFNKLLPNNKFKCSFIGYDNKHRITETYDISQIIGQLKYKIIRKN